MKIVTLGNCCKKSQKNHENAVIAAKNCGITEPVESIGDMSEIMKYGVMANPRTCNGWQSRGCRTNAFSGAN